MAQRNIWGEFEPEFDVSATDLMRRLDEEMPSGDKQRIMIAVHPATDAFLEDARRISSKDTLWRRFLRWLTQIGSLETICRSSRPSKTQGDGESSKPRKPRVQTTPDWYRRYGETQHWEDLRRRAMVHYGGCVLCGNIDGPQHLHHRHYNSVGNEQIRDLSILCHAHHRPTHQMLGLSVPRVMPDAVEKILRIEEKL